MQHLISLWQAVPALAAMLLVLFGGRLVAGATRRQAVRDSSKGREGEILPAPLRPARSCGLAAIGPAPASLRTASGMSGSAAPKWLIPQPSRGPLIS